MDTIKKVQLNGVDYGIGADFEALTDEEIDAICVPTTDTETKSIGEGLIVDEDGKLRLDPDYVVDYITEQGTSGIWTYRKWNSGIAECWGKTDDATIDVTSAWGGVYSYDSAIKSIPFPFTFIEIPRTQATQVAHEGNFHYWLVTAWAGDKGNSPSYGVARGTTASGLIASANLYVIGKWK